MPANIIFRGCKDDEPGGVITVEGDPEEVRNKLRRDEPVTQLGGGVTYVNWSNVLRVEEGYGPAVAPTVRPPAEEW
jgi:hypothetical protein